MKNKPWITFFGLLYVAAWIIGLSIDPGPPAPTLGQVNLIAYFTSHQQSHMIQSFLIDGIAGIALLVFSSGIYHHVQGQKGKPSALSAVVFGAGIAASSISLIQAGVQETLTNPVILHGNTDIPTTLLVLVNQMDTFKLLALALFSAAVSAVIFRTRAFPIWLGWVGTVLSLLLIFGGMHFMLGGLFFQALLFISLPVLLLWIAALSIAVSQTNNRKMPDAISGQFDHGI